jgi:hypothetical protein
MKRMSDRDIEMKVKLAEYANKRKKILKNTSIKFFKTQNI